MSNTFSQLSQYVEKKFGITLQDHQTNRVMNALDNAKKTLHLNDEKLINGLRENNFSVLNAVISAVTVQESYFFRDQSLFNHLKESYLPQLIQKKINKNDYVIKIWSAGCARGEEIYTLSILLKELIPFNNRWEVNLIGSDINQNAIDDAKKAEYTSASLRRFTEEQISLYFEKKDGKFYLKADFKKNVNFTIHNLLDPYFIDSNFDIILCRNVFIYFSNKAVENVLNLFFQKLNIEGRLFLGPSDIICFTKHQFIQKMENGATFLIKNEPINKIVSLKKENEKAESKVYALEQSKISQVMKEIRKEIPKNPGHALHIIDHFVDEQKTTALLFQYKAEALLALNDIDTADEYCELSLKANKNNHLALLLKGMIQFEKNNFSKASIFLKQAIAIKPDCIEANYYLAQISIAEMDFKNGILLLKQVLIDAEKKDASHTLFGFEKEPISTFINEVKSEIKFLQERVSHE